MGFWGRRRREADGIVRPHTRRMRGLPEVYSQLFRRSEVVTRSEWLACVKKAGTGSADTPQRDFGSPLEARMSGAYATALAAFPPTVAALLSCPL